MTDAEPFAQAASSHLQVLYEDNHLLGVLKPAGLLSQSAEAGDDNLVDRARAYLKRRYDKPGNVYVGLVHRLDRNVSGVVVLARTSKAASRLARAFAARAVEKRYLAVVEGNAPPEGQLRDRLGPRDGERGVSRQPEGKEAVLTFRRLAFLDGRSLLEILPVTGRKHQIRAQLALTDLPIVGDPLYGRRARVIGRPALHGASIELAHPTRSEVIRIEAPVPDDLAKLFSRFDQRSEAG